MDQYTMDTELYPWQPGIGDRILVFAPHPDDEVLAAGGLIATILESASCIPPRVVVVTNGDASYATALLYGTHSLSKRNFRSIALNRQQETLNALASLGLHAPQVSFWGFPDRGLKFIWELRADPDQHFVSPTTGFNRSEQSINSPITLYNAASLLTLLQRELIEFRPTTIIMPHPKDAQADHKALAYFILFALSSIQYDSYITPPTTLAYLLWLREKPWLIPARLDDPSFLPTPQDGSTIYCLALPEEIHRKKAIALKSYRSQKFSARQLLKDASYASYEYFVQMNSYPDVMRDTPV